MGQARELAPHSGDDLAIDLDDAEAHGLTEIQADLAPGIDGEGVAEGAPAAAVVSDLGRGEHPALALDGAGAQEQVPVCATGGGREGRGRQQHLRAGVHEALVERREIDRPVGPQGRSATTSASPAPVEVRSETFVPSASWTSKRWILR